jgi:hypothetical protein
MENLDHYEGYLLKGKLHGKGKLVKANGVIVEGNFKNGIPDGKVEITFPDGRVYQLELNDGIVIKEELVKGKKTQKSPHLNPFQPNINPNIKSKPKSSSFFFPGAGLEE